VKFVKSTSRAWYLRLELNSCKILFWKQQLQCVDLNMKENEAFYWNCTKVSSVLKVFKSLSSVQNTQNIESL